MNTSSQLKSVDATSIVSLAQNYLSSEVDGATIVMSLSAGKYLGFDKIGSAIWTRLSSSPVRVCDLADELATRFPGPSAVIASDLIEFLNRLAEYGLLVVE